MLIINAKTAATALKLHSLRLTPVFKCVSKFTSHSKRYTTKKYGNEWRKARFPLGEFVRATQSENKNSAT